MRGRYVPGACPSVQKASAKSCSWRRAFRLLLSVLSMIALDLHLSGCGAGAVTGGTFLGIELTDDDDDPESNFDVTDAGIPKATFIPPDVIHVPCEMQGGTCEVNGRPELCRDRVTVNFDLAKGSRSEPASTKVIYEVKGEKRTIRGSKGPFNPGKGQSFTFDTLGVFGQASAETLLVTVCPQGGRDINCKKLTCIVDNREAPFPATNEGCLVENGSFTFKCSFDGFEPEEKDITPAILRMGDEPITGAESVTTKKETSNGRAIYVTRWNSTTAYPDKSESLVAQISVKAPGAGRRDGVYTFGSCFRANNTKPVARITRVSSYPPVVNDPEGTATGKVIIDYEIVDEGSEDAKVVIRVKFGKVTLSTRPDGTELPLTEATKGEGGESEGTGPLMSSLIGKEHTFIWNSDYDLDRLREIEEPGKDPIVADLNVGDLTVELSVEDALVPMLGSEAEPALTSLNNERMHTVAGVIPGQTERGKATVNRDDVIFDTVAAVEIADGQMYIVDQGTNTIWKMSLNGSRVERAAGNGSRRSEGAEAPSGESPRRTALLDPVDIAIVGRDEFVILEREGGKVLLVTDTVETLIDQLARPLAMTFDPAKRQLFIADTGNCRIIHYDLNNMEATVIVGELQTVDPTDVIPPQIYPFVNGCNYNTETCRGPFSPCTIRNNVQEDNCQPGFRNAPAGVAYYSCGDREFLFFSEPLARMENDPLTPENERKRDRVVAFDLASRQIVRTLAQAGGECPTFPGNLFTRPKALEIVDPDGPGVEPSYLYVINDGLRISGGAVSRGLVQRAPIVEDCAPAASPSLGSFEPIVGRVSPFTEDESQRIACSCSDSSVPTYSEEQECLRVFDTPVANPNGVAVGPDGKVYFADRFNQRVRVVPGDCEEPVDPALVCLKDEVTKRSKFTDVTSGTFVGNTVQGPSRVPPGEEVVLGFEKLRGEGGHLLPVADGMAAGDRTKLSRPWSLVFLDNTNLLITESGAGRIRRLDLKTGLLTTIAGRDPPENLPCRQFNDGNGLATDAVLSGPTGIAIYPRFRPQVEQRSDDVSDFWLDPMRRVYFSDNNRIRMIDHEGRIRTIAGTGTRADFPKPCCAEKEQPSSAFPFTALGRGDEVFLNRPNVIAVDSEGRIFFADVFHRILKIEDPDNPVVVQVAGNPRVLDAVIAQRIIDQEIEECDDLDEFAECRQMIAKCLADPLCLGRALITPNTEFDEELDDPSTPRIEGFLELPPEGGPATEAYLGEAGAMIFDEKEEFLYYADSERGRIRRIAYDKQRGELGLMVTVAGGKLSGTGGSDDSIDLAKDFCGDALGTAFGTISGIDIDERDPIKNLIYFTVGNSSRIYRFRLDTGRIEHLSGFEAAGSVGDGEDVRRAAVQAPRGLKLDRDGNVYFADERNHRVRRFTPSPVERCDPLLR